MSRTSQPLATVLLVAVSLIGWAPLCANDIVNSARAQIGVTVAYDHSYAKIPFPNGDVPRSRGVCSDVVVRALRDARHIDLQREINSDLAAHWDAYPHKWAWLRFSADPNIDHRRVGNLMAYFSRRGYSRELSNNGVDYSPGDIVAWDLGGGTLHIGVVSDVRSSDGYPLIIHNIGRGVKEEDVLFHFRIIGHYRLPLADKTNDRAVAEVRANAVR